MLDYAQRTSLVICKRLGWICEQMEMFPDLQEQLTALPMTYYQKLDPSGSRQGKYNNRWKLMENI